ncbi:hypothetical protein B0G80_4405 [Paraburkholderia sp. BL6669N2]|uniref:hypothetical protein n=1 Tax=Paraburkholderia sp. BL6669N2 TaxID=1938807 RepID=UPI000E2428C3|nr:hypothetical protein [Paraburkholderia sp. BL6669N2]REG61552.1 hypothetical protein B0G80_4405 [Paraburkholderia sp. BL6669N2]
MSNFEHGAIVAELTAGIDAACEALRAATAVCDGGAVKVAKAMISRLVNDLQVAGVMEAAGRVDDAARAKDDLQTAIEATLGPSIDALNRALLGVGIPFLIGPEDEGLVSAARGVAVARRQYEQAQAAGVDSGDALRELCIATALLERRQAQVLARVAKQHIAHAETATAAAYAAAEKLGEITDRHLGAGAWGKLLAC